MRMIITESNQDISILSHYGTASINTYYNVIDKYPDIWWFARIKVRPEHWGSGHGKDLMIELCRILDQRNIMLMNELNPYGNRDMNSLISFFKASGFEMADFETYDSTIMIRRPNNGC